MGLCFLSVMLEKNELVGLMLKGEEQMVACGEWLSSVLDSSCLIFLLGRLGAGKTTLVRGVLRGLGYEGRVKSPTYTVVEPYECRELIVYHFDLLRINDFEELECLDARECLNSNSICLVEWPNRGKGFWPEADIEINIGYLPDARRLMIQPKTKNGIDRIRRLDLKKGNFPEEVWGNDLSITV